MVSPNTKHSFALILTALGVVSLLTTVACVAVVFQEKAHDAGPGWLGCAAVSGGLGAWLLWRAMVMRKRAMAAGSTMHIDHSSGGTWTSRTETSKPSFLRDEEAPE